MNGRNTLAGIGLAVGLIVGTAIPHAQATSQTPPDNTAVNTRDRAPAAKTADQQGNSKADLEMTQKIRRAITQDKTMSTYAHNVKVITLDGHVTLKGPVHTAAEKSALEAKAIEIAGAGKVTNQISVTTSNNNRTSSEKDH